MSLTGIIRNAFIPRQHKLERHFTEPEALQHDVLQHLLHTAAGTEYGRNHLFGNTRSYDDFVRNVPVNTYEELKGDIDRMRHGESSILWPGTVNGMPSHRALPTTRVSLYQCRARDCIAYTIKEAPTL